MFEERGINSKQRIRTAQHNEFWFLDGRNEAVFHNGRFIQPILGLHRSPQLIKEERQMHETEEQSRNSGICEVLEWRHELELSINKAALFDGDGCEEGSVKEQADQNSSPECKPSAFMLLLRLEPFLCIGTVERDNRGSQQEHYGQRHIRKQYVHRVDSPLSEGYGNSQIVENRPEEFIVSRRCLNGSKESFYARLGWQQSIKTNQ